LHFSLNIQDLDNLKALVNKYLEQLKNPAPTPEVPKDDGEVFKKGDLVSIIEGAVYCSGKPVPEWVIEKNWYVYSVSGSRVVIDKSEDGKSSIMSPIEAKYLNLVKKASQSTSSNTQSTTNTCTGKIDGYNIPRTTDALIIYNKGTNAPTNQWGTEVAVNSNNIVINNPVYGAGKMTIPSGGYVISGHGFASKWIGSNIKKD
jgi:hypothetical protein